MLRIIIQMHNLYIIILLSLFAIIYILWLIKPIYCKSEPRTHIPVISEDGNENIVWPNISGCEQFVTKFAKRGTLARRALASYPGSGNTWLRFLIEGATGIYTGSVYMAPGIVEAGHQGEGRPFDDGSTIFKRHILGIIHLTCRSIIKLLFIKCRPSKKGILNLKEHFLKSIKGGTT